VETWKPVLGFETLYEVSDHGNVRRTARGKTLDGAKVAEAKRMFEQGALLREVAAFLGTSLATASNIKRGNTWTGDTAHRALAPRPNRTHYLIVDLCRESKYAKKAVHRLVWEAFNGPIPGRLEVNHKDLDRANNHLSNLELLTHQQNIQHAHAIYKRERAHLPKGSRSGPYGRYENVTHD
jgi:hypothetical protein